MPALVVLILECGFLGGPFGLGEINGGSYFGPFAITWDQHGFGWTHGVPIWSYRYQGRADGIPYVNHPPGFAWLSGLGVSEWAVRLPSVIGMVVGAVLLVLILEKYLSPWKASIVALSSVATPCWLVACRSSYEPLVVAAGLALIWIHGVANPRTPRETWRHHALSVLLSFTGVWLDWPFLFWIAATTAFLNRHTFKRMLLTVYGPATLSLAVLAWWHHAARAGLAAEGLAIPTFVQVFTATRAGGPPLTEVLGGLGA